MIAWANENDEVVNVHDDGMSWEKTHYDQYIAMLCSLSHELRELEQANVQRDLQ